MAYSKSWNEAQPAGSEAANTLDTIIQNLKISIRERLEDLFPTWTSDATDPKLVNSNFIQVFTSAAYSGRSATPARAGNVHFAQAERTLSVGYNGLWYTTGPVTAVYNPAQAPGTRVSSLRDYGFHVCFKTPVFTLVGSTVSFRLDEISSMSLSTANLLGCQIGFHEGGDRIHGWEVTLPSALEVLVTFYDYTGGTPALGNIGLYVHMIFKED